MEKAWSNNIIMSSSVRIFCFSAFVIKSFICPSFYLRWASHICYNFCAFIINSFSFSVFITCPKLAVCFNWLGSYSAYFAILKPKS